MGSKCSGPTLAFEVLARVRLSLIDSGDCWNFQVLCFLKYHELAHRVDEAMSFMAAAGLIVDHPIWTTTNLWTSHECLLLPYEQALTREDSTSGLYYDCSAHMIWVGE
ncbi:hypothetical protein FXO37_25373 [Capsicum annuum]|nr:hypothetical protein FXO37_25373 [Capsicum annuum]